MTTLDNAKRQVIDRLAEALSGRLDLVDGAALFHPDVIVHMDGYTFRGVAAWKTWVGYIRSRPGMEGLDIVCDGVTAVDADTITAFGRWRAGVGPISREKQASATYRFHEGRIAELWTTRGNYEMMFGPLVKSRFGLLLVFARLLVWTKIARRQSAARVMLGQA